MTWKGHRLEWGDRTHIMAILNLTPDSFSGDGMHPNLDAAVAAGLAAESAGAHLLDVGGESTRPGHTEVPAKEEVARVLPVIRALAPTLTIPISVDTSKAEVAAVALEAGASLLNDVRGLTRDPDLASVVAETGVPVVLMHDLPPESGRDLVASVIRELVRRIDRAVARGVAYERIIVDPGFGFGKDWRQNLELLDRLGELRAIGRPLLIGLSRKRTIGHVLGTQEQDRLEGTLATTVMAIDRGADIVRVHDVRANVRAARMADAVVRRAGGNLRSENEPPVATAYIGVGANLGDRARVIRDAVDELSQFGSLVRISSLYETDPVGYEEQPPFLNGVVALESTLTAGALLAAMQAIEDRHGRERSFANAPRTLDLDLLLYGHLAMETPDLVIPHPRLHQRAFVLVPLAEIAPNLVHPTLNRTIAELLAEVGRSGVSRWSQPPDTVSGN